MNIAEDSPSIWLKGMGGSTVGVWAAHGEGQVLFPDAAVQAAVLDSKLAPIRWVCTVVNNTWIERDQAESEHRGAGSADNHIWPVMRPADVEARVVWWLWWLKSNHMCQLAVES